MSGNADWIARRLQQIQQEQGQHPRPQPAVGPHYPPVTPPMPGQLPAHLAPYAQQPAAPQTPQAFVGAQPGQTPQAFTSYDANTGAQVADDGTVEMLYNSAAQTGGSKTVRENSTTCPNCHGSNYFTIQGGAVFSKAAGGQVHAMQCADCGFPTVQAGSQGGALQTARSAGPARAARQLPSNHRVSVVVEGGRVETFDPPTGG